MAYTTAYSQSPAAARIAGIDIARAIALVGMLMVHFGPDIRHGVAGTLYALPHGRASILFAVVAGVGMALLTRREEARGLARLRLAWFAVILLPIGLVLQSLEHPIAVILHHYAFFFLFGLLICGLPRRALLGLAIVAMVLGPTLYQIGRMEAVSLFARRAVEFGDPALSIFQGLLTAGPYPLLTWAGPVAFGLYLGRLDLRDAATRWLMVGLGLTAALLVIPLSALGMAAFGEPANRSDWQSIFSAAAHSQMPLWLTGSTGSATAIIGVALIVGDRLGRLATPLVMLGQFVLTAYIAHILLLALWQEQLQRDMPGQAMLVVLGYVALVIGFAALWQRLVSRRGPVEWVMHAPWDALRRQMGRERASPGLPHHPPAE